MHKLYYDKNLESEIKYLQDRYSMLSLRHMEETCKFEIQDLEKRLLELEAHLKKMGVNI